MWQACKDKDGTTVVSVCLSSAWTDECTRLPPCCGLTASQLLLARILILRTGLEYFYNVETKETTWDKPAELMSADEMDSKGAWYWLPDPNECFVPVRVASSTATTVTGIDAHGHTAALNARGTTAAVLGGSLLNIYPPQNQTLAARILHESSGVLLSETRPDLTVRADRLVARNRLIAALSDTIIVVESNEDGGAMHVARWAHKLDRALYTVDLPASGNQRMIEAGVAVT